VKVASKDSLTAFKLLALNPVGELSSAFQSLGEARGLAVGIVFGVVFAICCVLVGHRLIPQWLRPGGFFFKILVVSFVPFLSLLGASALVRTFFRGRGGLGADSFIAGASLLPFGVLALLGSFLGLGNLEVIALAALFANCLVILMLFAALTRIYALSERQATLAVPLMLVVTAWLCKVVYAAML
jgi:hypothetical protein